MVNLLSGMRVDRRDQKGFILMVMKMDYGLDGMEMDRRSMKKLTRMG